MGTLFAALVGTILAFKFVQRFQLLEGSARAELSLNIGLKTDLFEVPSGLGNAGKRVVIETRVDIKNNSRRACCIPAVYVSARALFAIPDDSGDLEYEGLPRCGKLSAVKNVARIHHSIIQLAPDETEQFVRWDTLDHDFLGQYPVIVVNAEVFAAEFEHLGQQHYPKPQQGPLFREWVTYMESDDGIRQRYVVFDRWSPNGGECPLRPFQRYLRSPSAAGGPDLLNSEKFERVLSSVVRWSRHATVVLAAPSMGSPGEP